MLDKIKKIVVEQLGVEEEEITLESSFIDDLGADSLDIVELIMALEEEFDLEIPDSEAEKFLQWEMLLTTLRLIHKKSPLVEGLFLKKDNMLNPYIFKKRYFI